MHPRSAFGYVPHDSKMHIDSNPILLNPWHETRFRRRNSVSGSFKECPIMKHIRSGHASSALHHACIARDQGVYTLFEGEFSPASPPSERTGCHFSKIRHGKNAMKLTKLLSCTTPSLTHKPQEPIIFAIITSVKSRSPTMAIWLGDVTLASGAFRK